MYQLSQDDGLFRHNFESGALLPADFTHRAHLRLAYLHLAEHGIEAAFSTFRQALLAYLAHHRIDPGKFHATLTHAWLLAVSHFMVRAEATLDCADFLDRSSELLNPKLMLTHYSKEVLFSEQARQVLVVPDISPLPEYALPAGASGA